MSHGSALRRELGLVDAVAVGFGAIIGAGIFVVTGLAAALAGPALLLALLIAGSVAAANALSSARLAAEMPQSGGTYEYGYQLIGPWTGFVAGWMFLAAKVSAAGTVALGLSSYIAPLLPGVTPALLAAGLLIGFTILNLVGIQRTSRVNIAIVTVSIGALLIFAVTALTQFESSHLTPFMPRGWASVLEASALLFFAYTGYARIATLGEEVRDPERTIPAAVVITIIGAVGLYILVAAAALGVTGAAALGNAAAPLSAAAEATGAAPVQAIVAVGAVTAMMGVLLSQVLGLSRMLFAMSRRGDMPSLFSHVHHRRGVPDRAIVAVGLLAAIVAMSGSLKTVAAASAFCILLYYAIANLAALRLSDERLRMPRAVPWFGLFGCGVLAINLPFATLRIGLIVLLSGLCWRALQQYRPR